MFNIGDKVVYPMHGAGVIEAIEEREILGEYHKYYILKMPINELKVMIPVKNVQDVGVRKILDKDRMNKVLEELSSNEGIAMPKNWNRRYRFNLEKIKSGDLIEIAGVVKSLEQIDAQKSLSTGERKLLTEARQIIISEMALVYQKDIEEIIEMVDDAVLG
ncbi:MAG: CarD family transcriptional regulator [Tissierellia bacterium]|nr:CarD family transcriptional regulator [Tissierellia bacterium]